MSAAHDVLVHFLGHILTIIIHSLTINASQLLCLEVSLHLPDLQREESEKTCDDIVWSRY
jgi:hypothetical protein